MAREGGRGAFNGPQASGRMGFREPDEPEDGRPVIARGACRCTACREYLDGFWKGRMEQATYEAAVAGSPRREGEGPMAYIRRISEIVTREREAGAKAMPHLRMTRRERDAVLERLRAQARE